MGLKVYGCNMDGRNRGIVAAKSKKEAASLLGMSLYYFNEYGSDTGNREEVELAMREPGVVWVKPDSRDGEWKRQTEPKPISTEAK